MHQIGKWIKVSSFFYIGIIYWYSITIDKINYLYFSILYNHSRLTKPICIRYWSYMHIIYCERYQRRREARSFIKFDIDKYLAYILSYTSSDMCWQDSFGALTSYHTYIILSNFNWNWSHWYEVKGFIVLFCKSNLVIPSS